MELEKCFASSSFSSSSSSSSFPVLLIPKPLLSSIYSAIASTHSSWFPASQNKSKTRQQLLSVAAVCFPSLASKHDDEEENEAEDMWALSYKALPVTSEAALVLSQYLFSHPSSSSSAAAATIPLPLLPHLRALSCALSPTPLSLSSASPSSTAPSSSLYVYFAPIFHPAKMVGDELYNTRNCKRKKEVKKAGEDQKKQKQQEKPTAAKEIGAEQSKSTEDKETEGKEEVDDVEIKIPPCVYLLPEHFLPVVLVSTTTTATTSTSTTATATTATTATATTPTTTPTTAATTASPASDAIMGINANNPFVREWLHKAQEMKKGPNISSAVSSPSSSVSASSSSSSRFPLSPLAITSSPAKFTFASLFSGIGGFEIALQWLGGECVFACEKNEVARAIFRANCMHLPSNSSSSPSCHFASDITQVNIARDVPHHDILVAGFPCQPYTSVGLQQGFADRQGRGSLLSYVFAMLKQHQPQAVLLENVPGLLTTENGACFVSVIAQLAALGYKVAHTLINSKELTPQFRKRLYIVCLRNKNTLSSSLSSFSSFASPLSLSAAPNYTPAQQHFQWPLLPSRHLTVRCILQPPLPRLPSSSPAAAAARPLLSEAFSKVPAKKWQKIVQSENFTKYPHYHLAPLDGLSATLTSGYKGGNLFHSQFVGMNPSSSSSPSIAAAAGSESVEPRLFTPRECLRLQGFPSCFLLDAPLCAQRAREIVQELEANARDKLISTSTKDHAERANTKEEREERREAARAAERFQLLLKPPLDLQYGLSAMYKCVGNAVSPPIVACVAAKILCALFHCHEGETSRCLGGQDSRCNSTGSSSSIDEECPFMVRALQFK